MQINAKDVLRSPQEEISRLCEIDLDDLQECLRQHAVLYGRAYSYYMSAKAKENNAKWLYEREKQEAFSRLRDKGMAVTAAKEEREVQSEVLNRYEEYLKAEKRTGIFYALLKGLEHRKDMLVQLSSREKKEYGLI